jgi:benzoyl-CoA-dihydrodiol lyase
MSYPSLVVDIDDGAGTATFTIAGPEDPPPESADAIHAAGVDFWPLAVARALDDAILYLRANRPEIGTWIFRSQGDGERVMAYDAVLEAHAGDWLAREITLFLKRVLKRLDVTSRSLIALIEPDSCFAGTLFELVLAADRSYMLDGESDGRPAPSLWLGEMNFGAHAMANGLSRLETRFLDAPDRLAAARAAMGGPLDARAADALGLVTFIPDDIDWEDEVRLAIEERASFSPDALTGMEANLRFAGPETLETKIFARLTAWQNWIFQRPNAAGENGALKRYGSGQRAAFDKTRV